jgi:hypothetical protein
LGAASNPDAAFVRLTAGLAQTERAVALALLRVEPRAGLFRAPTSVTAGKVERAPLETSLEQLPAQILRGVQEGGTFVEVTEEQGAYARLLKLDEPEVGGALILRGIRVDRQLVAVIAAVEPKRVFGTRVTERLGPLSALFELAAARFVEREARAEAVSTLEAVTQRVHGDYLSRLAELEQQLAAQTGELQAQGASAEVAREGD